MDILKGKLGDYDSLGYHSEPQALDKPRKCRNLACKWAGDISFDNNGV
jgi:hypothetical protein